MMIRDSNYVSNKVRQRNDSMKRHAMTSEDESTEQLYRCLPRSIDKRRQYFAPQKELTSDKLRASFKTSSDLQSYLVFCRQMHPYQKFSLKSASKHSPRIAIPLRRVNRVKPLRLRSEKQVYCQGWFADRSQMQFKMNEYFTLRSVAKENKSHNEKRNQSFQFHPSNRARCERQLRTQSFEEKVQQRDEVRYTFNRMLKEIDREVSREQRDSTFEYKIRPALCEIGDTKLDLDRVCEKSSINMGKLQTLLKSTKYKSRMDTIIGLLKE